MGRPLGGENRKFTKKMEIHFNDVISYTNIDDENFTLYVEKKMLDSSFVEDVFSVLFSK